MKKYFFAIFLIFCGFSHSFGGEVSLFAGGAQVRDVYLDERDTAFKIALEYNDFNQFETALGWGADAKFTNATTKFYDFSFFGGIKFGQRDYMGEFRLLPLGIGFLYSHFKRDFAIGSDPKHSSPEMTDFIDSLYYKLRVEYFRNLDFDTVLNLGFFYQRGFYSFSADDSWNFYSMSYKPRGIGLSAGIEYFVDPKVSLGLNLAYTNVNDYVFNKTRLYVGDGLSGMIGLRYSFD